MDKLTEQAPEPIVAKSPCCQREVKAYKERMAYWIERADGIGRRQMMGAD